MKQVRVLDCTLRDGGFYTKWDFEGVLVSNYLKAMQDSGVDIVEIGYRSLQGDDFFGELVEQNKSLSQQRIFVGRRALHQRL